MTRPNRIAVLMRSVRVAERAKAEVYARQCGVSIRTIKRDWDHLRKAGIALPDPPTRAA